MNKNEKIIFTFSAIAGILVLVAFHRILFKAAKRITQIHIDVLQEPIKIILSAKQEKEIAKLHPKAQEIFRKFVDEIEKSGYTANITSSYRTFAQQAVLYALNKNNAKVGLSPHNYGMALDIVLLKGLDVYNKNISKAKWEATGIPAIAKNLGLRWGGDFIDYHDPVHFDLSNKYPSATLLAFAHKQFGNNPADIKGNEVIIT